MSWNCLGPDVCGADVLEAADALVPDDGVALLDDGWMPWWGDWQERPDFDTSITDLAATLHAMGRRLGVWLAPFLVDPRSRTGALWPDLLLRDAGDRPVVDSRPPASQWVLDASRSAARDHLAEIGARMGRSGVAVLKLDFLYAGALPGRREEGWTGVRALRAGVGALVDAFRATAPPGAAVWACGAPAPPLVGLVDACRSGGDSVVNIPVAHAEPPVKPWFLAGEAVNRAQARNLGARAWLWGSTLPPDADAVSLGAVGYSAPLDDALARRWLELGVHSGGPLLVADEPTGASIPAERLEELHQAQRTVMGTAPRPARPRDPLAMRPAPMGDDVFLSWPADTPEVWERGVRSAAGRGGGSLSGRANRRAQ
jgi:hypothetical protein